MNNGPSVRKKPGEPGFFAAFTDQQPEGPGLKS